MTEAPAGRQLSLSEAVQIFETMPAQWQLASLHPSMVELDAARDEALRPIHWCFQANGHGLIHSFQLADNPGLAVRDVQSPYGYGGPLSNTEDPEFLKAAEDAFAAWAKASNVIAEFVRFHPLVPHARWYAGQIVDNRETVHIDLAKELFEQYETRRRTYVRRFLESTVRVERVSSQFMSGVFPDLYKHNMDQVGAKPEYYFPEKYFDGLFRFASAENWLAYAGSEPIAAAVILASARAGVAEYFLGAKASGFDRQRAMIGLIHRVAEHYQSLSFRCLYLGGGRSVDPADSLLSFKKGFSSSIAQFQIGSRVYQPEVYAHLRQLLPAKAATGRVLFYKD
jgi:hypothetical protein